MNLFATVLTYPAPSANYRGESELNRSVIQKVTDGRFDYPIFSPESMRNALREILAGYGLAQQPRPAARRGATRRHSSPTTPTPTSTPTTSSSATSSPLGQRPQEDSQGDREGRGKEAAKQFTFKRDSILRMNLAKGLEPYRHNAVFTQSPLAAAENPAARVRQATLRPAPPRDRRHRVPVPVRPQPRRLQGQGRLDPQAASRPSAS